MKKILIATILLTLSLFASNKPLLRFYCGITMVKPMKIIAKKIEQKYNCKIEIIQGGSKDLYQSLSYSKVGDLYLPGSDTYITKNKRNGFFQRSEYVGYNQAAIFVLKNNPKNIKTLNRLLDENVATILCSPDSGSIGKMTKKLLIKYKGEEFYEDAFDATVAVGTDSRNLNKALIEKDADMTINWKATGFWPENAKFITVIPIDEKFAPKKKLMLTLLSFSEHKKIANAFIDYATSKKGQQLMKKYGFQ